MKTVLPREQAVEDIFSRILASPEASGRLRKVFYQYLDDEHMLVDQDPRAAYFDQVQNGKYIRMALIMALLEIPDPLTGRTVL